MHRYVRIDIDRLDTYYQRIEAFVARLTRRFRLSRVILFGSFARGKGDVHEMSDIDLVVVGDIPGDFFERIGAVRDLTRLPVEPWVYTDSEWKGMLDERRSFAREVIRTGVELYRGVKRSGSRRRSLAQGRRSRN